MVQLERLCVHMAGGNACLDPAPCCPEYGGYGVWLVSLTADTGIQACLARLLDNDELARAKAFLVNRARNQFVQVRAMLRLLLGQCMDQPASQISFTYGRYGKPALAQPCGLHFNVAHSGSYALLAVGNGVEVGVDIEESSATHDLDLLSGRVCSPAEEACWRGLPVEQRAEFFFSIWVAKEAIAKAAGMGLQLAFPELHIGTDYRLDMSGVTHVSSSRAGAFRLMSLPVPSGYAGALALRA